MEARILAASCRKGGVGKSSFCLILSGELAERGYKVLVCDCDGQQTATKWAASAADSMPFPAAVLSFAAYGANKNRAVA